jgi:hypothetical protein
MNYRQANRAYLEKSLATLRYLALAEQEGTTAGFGLGECRVYPRRRSTSLASAASRPNSAAEASSPNWSVSP